MRGRLSAAGELFRRHAQAIFVFLVRRTGDRNGRAGAVFLRLEGTDKAAMIATARALRPLSSSCPAARAPDRNGRFRVISEA